MRAICLYLHIHQPWRYRRYSIFDVAHNHNYWYENDYYDKQNNERIFRKVAEKSYHPMLDLIEKNARQHEGFKVSLSITGTWLEQAEEWDPELIRQIGRLVRSGHVEIVGETYYHSMSFFYDKGEFAAQVKKHADKVRALFGVTPRVFRNTEFAYNDEVGKWADEAGYAAVLAEGWDKVLGWKSPNYVYKVNGAKNGCKLLLKNYRLSDDIAFRFSNRDWKEWPLTVEKYQNWLNMDALRGNLINLFMDFETFGENIWEDTGIFDFMDKLIASWLKEYDNQFVTVSEAAQMEAKDEISMPQTVTWADMERDLSAWMSNEMQTEAAKTLYAMRPEIMAAADQDLIDDWRRLTTSDHTYYMCTKYWNDGDVHAYFSPFDSPFDAFMYYMNIIRDFEWRIENIRERGKAGVPVKKVSESTLN